MYNIEIVVVSTLRPYATAVISPSSSIPTVRVQLGHYAENHAEHYICTCVDGRVLLKDKEEQEEKEVKEVKDDKQEERAEEEVEDDGVDLLSTPRRITHTAWYV